ncbi:MAG: hypothetical protein QM479_06460 [Pseudomonadota bacterium]
MNPVIALTTILLVFSQVLYADNSSLNENQTVPVVDRVNPQLSTPAQTKNATIEKQAKPISHWEQAKRNADEAWQETKKMSDEAWKATQKGSAQAWDSTKETSTEVWKITQEGSKKAWGETKKASLNAWQATKEGSNEAWESTKEYSDKAWQETKSTVRDGADYVSEKTAAESGKINQTDK